MASADRSVQTYRALAERYDHDGQTQMRDRFLVLAADAALSAGHAEEAERLRVRLLQCNPQHLLKPYDSFAAALESQDIENYVAALRRSHPHERAEQLLQAAVGNGQSATPPAGSPSPPSMRESTDELKIYRVQPVESPKAQPHRKRAGLSNVKATPDAPAPRELPDIFAIRQEEILSATGLGTAPPAWDDREPAAGRWVASALFWITLLTCTSAALYILLRPLVAKAL